RYSALPQFKTGQLMRWYAADAFISNARSRVTEDLTRILKPLRSHVAEMEPGLKPLHHPV
ncbi:hypothetical protein ACJMK2_039024, partial [Sinanodonta woodiana]